MHQLKTACIDIKNFFFARARLLAQRVIIVFMRNADSTGLFLSKLFSKNSLGHALVAIIVMAATLFFTSSVSANFTTTTGNAAYSGSDTRPLISSFTGSGWGGAIYAQSTNGGADVPYNGVVTHMVLKQAPSWSNRPNEKILVTEDSQCRIVAQVFDGTSWGNVQVLANDYDDPDILAFGRGAYRLFDVAYASNPATGDIMAMVVYPVNNVMTNYLQLRYQTYDPNDPNNPGWSGEVSGFGYTGSGNRVRWLRLEGANVVRSTEIAMVINDQNKITARIWNGVDWGNNATREQVLIAASGQSVYQNFDMAYEGISGKLRVWYCDNTATPKGYAWNGSTWTAGGNFSALSNNPYYIRAVPQPGTNQIGLLFQDSTAIRLSVGVWTGAAFTDASVNQVTTMVNNLQTGRDFDGAWPTNTSSFTVVYMGAASQTAINAFSWKGVGAGWTTVVPIPTNMDAATGNTNFEEIIANSTGTPTDTIQITFTSLEDYAPLLEHKSQNLFGVSFNANTQAWSGTTVLSKSIVAAYHRPWAMAGNMLAYANYSPIPHMRSYSGGFGIESRNAPTSNSDSIRWVRTRASPTRDEKIVVTLDSGGTLIAQVYRPSGWIQPITLMTGLNNTGTNDFTYTRPFDVAYEQGSGRALVVYTDPTQNAPRYAVWDPLGTTWTTYSVALGPPPNGKSFWIRCESNPQNSSSNEIIVVTLDNRNPADLNGYQWTGYPTNTMNGPTNIFNGIENNNVASLLRFPVFDLKYESLTSRAMVVFAANNNDTFKYSFWMSSMTAWDLGPGSAGYTGRDVDQTNASRIRRMVLAADPTSNRLALAEMNNQTYPYVNIWNGSAWGTTPATGERVDGGTNGPIFALNTNEDTVYKNAFDIGWESSGDQVVLFYAQNGTNALRYAWWRAAAADWTTSLYNQPDTAGGDPEVVKVYPDPYSDQMNILVNTDKGYLIPHTWTGDVWVSTPAASYLGSSWLLRGLTQTPGNQFEPYDFAWTRDFTAPTSTVTLPANIGYYNSLPLITGTWNDGSSNTSGLGSISLQLQRVSDSFYYNGSSFTSAAVSLKANNLASSTWSYTVQYSTSLTDAHDYQVFCYATDKAGNVQLIYSTVTFSYDVTAPTATFTSHVNGAYISTTPFFTGISVDNYVGVSNVQISIEQYGSPNHWFTGSNFTSTSRLWFNVTPTGIGLTPYSSWSFATSGANWFGLDGDFAISVQAQDKTLQWQTYPTTITVHYDDQPPTAGIVAPTNGGLINNIPEISGTASDNMLNKFVFVAIGKDDGTWWNQNLNPSPDFSNFRCTYLEPGDLYGGLFIGQCHLLVLCSRHTERQNGVCSLLRHLKLSDR